MWSWTSSRGCREVLENLRGIEPGSVGFPTLILLCADWSFPCTLICYDDDDDDYDDNYNGKLRAVINSCWDTVLQALRWKYRIPDRIVVLSPINYTMALGSTQPLTKMSIKNICWGKGGRCVELTTMLLSCTGYLEFLGATTARSPKGLPGRYGMSLPLPLPINGN